MHYAQLHEARAELTGPGGAFEIAEIEVRGQHLRAYVHAPATVRDLWLSTAVHGDRHYLVYGDEALTYAEVHARAAGFAAWLWERGYGPATGWRSRCGTIPSG
ncbi:hypothetical protein AB5I41_26795 [Sphingomonas sp. MMS24-JH45]